ncbi:Acylglycerone-phosphate reductase [Purpureocillium takamizusanense]|uniref:Acylglycerone-phosphate reductase n=1 Tax=Purpureocillium takamizusanense TaxID=2060973 RepID=A0A9Q8QEM0_9HYPO|nr:Acylglycerone-phosphate reductase [Purpureocillium takamizusanense]UNI19404.1 Acylglycerone-phosphate reductase [Purpureocillium takamizusanense]
MGFPTDGVDNNGWKLYITSLVAIIVAGMMVISRCAARLWLSKLGWDDASIVLSLCFSIALSVSIQLAVEQGYGMHKSDLTKSELRRALQLFFIAQTPYKVTVWLNKISAVLLYLRIFISRGFRVSA